MIPIVSLVGTSNSGKTTFLIKLIAELKKRDYKVATVKHHDHDIEIDQPGKDTWRHAQAGAEQVALITANKAAIFYQNSEEITLEKILHKLSGVDLIIIEGFKQRDYQQIEIIRREVRTQLISNPENLIAVASDFKPLQTKVPVFDINDAIGMADLLEGKVLGIDR